VYIKWCEFNVRENGNCCNHPQTLKYSYLRTSKGATMLNIAIDAARKAGAYAKQHAGKARQIDRKEGQITNLVTEIDRTSESIIIERIRKEHPDHTFFGEESGIHQNVSEYKWVIDPLDGTTNFAHGLGIFCVSIGLEYKGEVILGVVYDPNVDELFTAEKGRGAFLNGKPIRVSKTDTLIESLLVTGFPYNIRENPNHAVEHFTNFLMSTQAVRRLGSAALDLCYTAAGRFDGFWEVSLRAWDMAAGVLILREAGGTRTDFEGKDATIYVPQMVASNGIVHEQMIEVLRRVKSTGERPTP
jgi:myo-inositol-1(or 4)-monophosphatase